MKSALPESGAYIRKLRDRRGRLLIAAYVGAALAPLAVAVWQQPQTVYGFRYELGRSAALAGIALLALQFLLSARLNFVERPYGLDILLRFHRSMGLTAFALLLAHPLLLASSGRGLELLFGLDQPWFVWLGRTTTLLVCLQIATSVFRRVLEISFEHWRRIHDVLAISALVAAYVHSWNAGRDLDSRTLQILWIALIGAALAAFGWHRFVKPRRLPRYRVDAVRREAKDVFTLALKPPEGHDRFEFAPGQFHFLKLQRDVDSAPEEHHFTISSSPAEGRPLTSTIKKSGDFTATIDQTCPGDTAIVEGPYGRFSFVLHPEEKRFAFLAAGIGITPLMSMLRYMRDTDADHDVLLLYGNHAEEDIVFREELEEMSKRERPNLRVVHVLSAPNESWQGERGHIDDEKIRRFCGNMTDRGYYLSGPRPMTKQAAAALRDLGIPSGKIHSEAFSFVESVAAVGSRDRARKWSAFAIVLGLTAAIVAAAVIRGL